MPGKASRIEKGKLHASIGEGEENEGIERLEILESGLRALDGDYMTCNRN